MAHMAGQTGPRLSSLPRLLIVQLAATASRAALTARHFVMASPPQTQRPLTRKLAPATKTGGDQDGLGGAGVRARPTVQAARDD